MGTALGYVTGAFGGGGESGSDGEAGTDGTDGATSNSGNGKLIEKIDELIATVKQGGNVMLDGRKVGDVMFLNSSPAGA